MHQYPKCQDQTQLMSITLKSMFYFSWKLYTFEDKMFHQFKENGSEVLRSKNCYSNVWVALTTLCLEFDFRASSI